MFETLLKSGDCNLLQHLNLGIGFQLLSPIFRNVGKAKIE